MIDPEAEAGYCVEQIRARNPFGPVRRFGGVAAYPRPGGVPASRWWPWPPVRLRDGSLPHQIVLERVSNGISVSCNCRYTSKRGGGFHEPLEVRTVWGDGEPMRVWREHLPIDDEQN